MIRCPRGARCALLLCLCLLSACLFAATVAADDDDEARVPAASSPLRVELAPEIQAEAGIGTRRLVAVERRPERRASARVISLQPLLARRADLLEARAKVDAAQAQFAASDDAYRRLRRLTSGSANVSGREMAGVRAKQRVDQAELRAAEARLANLKIELRHAWGANITHWLAADKPPAPWQALLDGRQVLAVLRLPAGVELAGVDTPVFVAAGERADARAATLLSPAVAAARDTAGESWLLRLDGAHLQPGMRLRAWVAQNAAARPGVVVPEQAVIWQDGAAWVYVRTTARTFARRPLPVEDSGGAERFVTRGLQAGDDLVIAGAQLLLGQELRAQIPEEDDD